MKYRVLDVVVALGTGAVCAVLSHRNALLTFVLVTVTLFISFTYTRWQRERDRK